MLGRRRPLLRGAVVGGAAYHIGKSNAQKQQAQQKQAASEQAAQDEQVAAGSKGGETTAEMDKITQLQKLHDSGALTDEEFASAKKKVIAEM
jgi:hypothetical protein